MLTLFTLIVLLKGGDANWITVVLFALTDYFCIYKILELTL